MSAIRPPVPSPLFPTQTPAAPARAARSDFFRAALQGVPAPVGEPEGATTATPSAAPALDRPQRPGALLDIRV
jgi:hypothetical protein